MITLAEFITAIRLEIADAAASTWTEDAIKQAISASLLDLSAVQPAETDDIITLPGPGREIALNTIAPIEGIIAITHCWWPYNSTLTIDQQRPSHVGDYHTQFDLDLPYLELLTLTYDSQEPQAEDEIRIWYSKNHTIQSLNSADLTSLTPAQQRIIIIGAAAHAALYRAAQIVNTEGADMANAIVIQSWGRSKMKDFRAAIAHLQAISRHLPNATTQQSSTWSADKWDTAQNVQ